MNLICFEKLISCLGPAVAPRAKEKDFANYRNCARTGALMGRSHSLRIIDPK